ncbi:MAG: NADH-quinone oxidoreductase subunit N [Candidatus Latescibacterota bacterium]|nr:MAG: NADH-quinone oxidoreductase subunit N [Candidatus Latescibacterota bacterium]
MTFPVVDTNVLLQLAPMLVLLLAGLVFMMAGAFTRRAGAFQRSFVIVFHIVVLVYVIKLWSVEASPILNGMLIVDRFSLFFTALVTLCALGTVLTSAHYLDRFGMNRGEFFSMLFFSTMGMVVLVSALDLISVFLGIELMSLAIYILVAFRRRDFLSNEAALKYFLIGAFAIGFFLYGVSLIYGVTGSTNFGDIAAAVAEKGLARNPLFLLAIALILAGLGFKVSSVPFHMWTPDVYQGAPTPITSFMATAVKAASFAAFVRLFYMCFMTSKDQWVAIIWVLAVVTMTVGNVVALVQRNIKRMMAYSSIAHAGYILIGIAALSVDNNNAASGIMFYVVVYAFMTLGAFALISAIEKKGITRGLEEPDYSGLGLERPFLGFCMAAFMFSLAGIPPTAGFFAKYYVFSAAVNEGLVGLVIIAVLNSALSLYYYLRVVVAMYMQRRDVPVPVDADLGIRIVLLISLLAVLWLGFGPSGVVPGVEDVLEWTRTSLAKVNGLGM